MRRYFILILFVYWAGFAEAQGCKLTLSGTVFDVHDKQPLPFATIFIKQLERGVVADINGNYEIEGLCQGNYGFTVSHVSCESIDLDVSISESGSRTFYLEHHLEQLTEIVVNAKAHESEKSQIHTAMNEKALESQRGKSLGETLKSMIGVRSLNSGGNISKPVIQGAFGNRIAIVNNDVAQEDQQWGNEHAPNIDVFSGNSISVVKGAAAVEYGAGAMGGVVIINPDTLPTAAGVSGEAYGIGQSNGRGGVGALNVLGGLKSEGWGWNLQGSYKRLGDLDAPDYVLSNTGLAESGFMTRLGYASIGKSIELSYSIFLSETGILQAAHTGNLTDLNMAIDSDVPLIIEPRTYSIDAPRQKSDHQTVKLKGGLKLKNGERLNMLYALQVNKRNEFDLRINSLQNNNPALDLQLNTHDLNFELNHKLSPKMNGKVGIQNKFQSNFNVPGTGVRPLIPNYSNFGSGIFLTEKYYQNDVELETGLRYDFKELRVFKIDRAGDLIKWKQQFHNYAFLVGAIWHASESMEVKTNLGRAFRAPHVAELFSEGLHHGAAAIERGNENLVSEKNIKWTGSLEYQKGPLSVVVEPYLTFYQDYIGLIPVGSELTVRGAFLAFEYFQTDATFLGFDTQVQYQVLENLQLTGAYSFLSAEEKSGASIPLVPANSFTGGIDYTGSNFDLEIQIEQVSQQNNFGATEPASPPDAYTILEGSATWKPSNSIDVGFRVSNLLNTKYRDYMNRLRYFSAEPGRNLILKIKYSF